MRPPSPRTCVIISATSAGGLAAWDLTSIIGPWDALPMHLHLFALAIAITSAVIGSIGWWVQQLVDLGMNMERARNGGNGGPPAEHAPVPSNVRRLPSPRPLRQREPLRQHAE